MGGNQEKGRPGVFQKRADAAVGSKSGGTKYIWEITDERKVCGRLLLSSREGALLRALCEMNCLQGLEKQKGGNLGAGELIGNFLRSFIGD